MFSGQGLPGLFHSFRISRNICVMPVLAIGPHKEAAGRGLTEGLMSNNRAGGWGEEGA